MTTEELQSKIDAGEYGILLNESKQEFINRCRQDFSKAYGKPAKLFDIALFLAGSDDLSLLLNEYQILIEKS